IYYKIMQEKEKNYKRFTVSIEEDLYTKFEDFRQNKNMSRSDAIRKAMRSYMISEENIDSVSSSDVVGCITLIIAHEHFDPTHEHPHTESKTHQHIHNTKEQHHEHTYQEGSYHTHDYTSQPIYANVQQTDLILKNDIQHHYGDIIISTMHIHLEFEKCLEIVAVAGHHKRVKDLYEDLQRLKSVLSIDFFVVDKEETFNK
ncbi:MAG: CopG family ribbon-helix-helix protein, partial [Candidatus Hermodarchaeota archaeon]